MVKKSVVVADTSFEQGMVAAFYSECLVEEYSLAVKQRHGQTICSKIVSAVKSLDSINKTVQILAVGLGPGSFVGLRVSLATMLGFGTAKNIPVMGFCSHLALAYSYGQGKDVQIVMKASGSLCYFSTFVFRNNCYHLFKQIEVLDIEQIHEQACSQKVLVSDNQQLIENFINAQKISGPTSEGINNAFLCRLNKVGMVDESAHIKPNYVKPPNVSSPKKSFVIARLLDQNFEHTSP